MPIGTIPELPVGLVLDVGNDELVGRVRACLDHPMADSFRRSLDVLAGLVKGHPGARVRLWGDFAPLSFEFVVILASGNAWLQGGLIYHGQHDGFGSGSAPTFSVSLNRAEGWQLHT